MFVYDPSLPDGTNHAPYGSDGSISRPRLVVTVSAEHTAGLRDRDVMFQNPLFVKQAPARFSINGAELPQIRVSFIRKFLDNNVYCVSFGVSTIFAFLFIVAPIVVAMHSENVSPKTKSFCLLFFCGILQPLLIRTVVSKATLDRLERNRTFWKLSILLITGMIAFRRENTPVPPNVEAVSTQELNHGNCSLLENIPDTLVRFANQNQNHQRHMLYDTSCDHGMPLVFKYDSILVSTMEVLWDIIVEGEFGKRVKEDRVCVQLGFNFFLFSAVQPCQNNCRRSEFLCKDQCDAIDRCTILTTLPTVSADSLLTAYGSAVDIFVGSQFEKLDNKNSNERKDWTEQVVRFLAAILNDGYQPSNCRSTDDIDKIRDASCYFFDGTVYHSKHPLSTTKSRAGLNCSMEYMYETLKSKKAAANSLRAALPELTVFDGVVIAAFYLHGCYVLFMWMKQLAFQKSSRSRVGHTRSYRHNTGSVRLNMRSISYLLFLGVISCVFGFLIFYVAFLRVEDAFVTKYEFSLSWIYFMLGGSASIALTMGLSTMVHAIFNRHGEIVNEREQRQLEKGVKQRNRPSSTKTNDIVCIRWLALYRNNTRPRGGKWFFAKMLFWECFEISLQTTSLHQFASHKHQEYVILSSTLLLFNMIATPILFYKSAYASVDNISMFNGFILTVDTTIDTLFFALNLSYLEARDLYESPFVGTASLAWPVFCVMMRLRSLSRLVLVQYMQDIIRARQSSRLSRNDTKKSFRTGKTILVFAILIGVAMFTLVQFLFVISSSHSINAKCASELGQSLWNGASPKYTFSNGIFGTPTCAYDKILSIHAPVKQLSSISKYIGMCTSLKVLNLAQNNIVDLPRELLMMGGINVVDLTANPVQSTLVARNMSLMGGIPPFIIRHLNESLENLDLSNNFLNHINDSIGLFQKLRSLKVDNNALDSDSLAWEVVKLQDLNVLSLAGNVLHADVDWSNQFRTHEFLDAAAKFLIKHFYTSLLRLNVSHNAFKKSHFDMLVNRFPHLISFDISFNKELKTSATAPLTGISNLTQLKFMSLEGNVGISYINMDDLVYMEHRTVSKITKFQIRRIGLDYLIMSRNLCGNVVCITAIKHCEDVSCLKRTGAVIKYPRELMKQLWPTVRTFRIQDTVLEGFNISDLCKFSRLISFRWAFPKNFKGMKPIRLPDCILRMQGLLYLDLTRTGIIPPQNITLGPNMTSFTWVLNTNLNEGFHGNFRMPFPGIETPNFRSFEELEVVGFIPPMPQEYRLFPQVTYGVFPSKNESYKFEVPKDWDSFDTLELRGMEHSYDDIVGTVSHLTIGLAAILDDTNVSGPLFRVGPDFKCMVLHDQHQGREAFQNKWNVTCTALGLNTCPTTKAEIKTWQRLQDNVNPCNITNAINCSLPTTTKSAPLPTLCFAIPYDRRYEERTGIRWECFEERFFDSQNKCEKFFVGRKKTSTSTVMQAAKCGK